jgi:predicted anti-sigma-YlaC factor YlaD
MYEEHKMKKHLTTDELVDRFYGLEAEGHLEECEECAERFRQLGEQRAMAAEAIGASHEFLAAQRRNIYARMGEKPQGRMKWVPAVAAAVCLLAVSILSHRPVAQVAKPEVADAQLFSDVYSMEQSMEPIAAKPIHAIFEDQ